ncbi:hypothetical protein E2562_027288 [Oryza meyeriana var. granulata]|uniref:Uncharacterized protein n=1 Tax=Oryza meyeriana var. granulata TaxID=110450 RepID=A0A6G1CAV7_9ORYZ|nr:hypothetical protein E2562_027288 [Oryza meyeriana var. granulata]
MTERSGAERWRRCLLLLAVWCYYGAVGRGGEPVMVLVEWWWWRGLGKIERDAAALRLRAIAPRRDAAALWASERRDAAKPPSL